MNNRPHQEPRQDIRRRCLLCGYPFRSMQEAKRIIATDELSEIVSWQCRDQKACNARAVLRSPHLAQKENPS